MNSRYKKYAKVGVAIAGLVMIAAIIHLGIGLPWSTTHSELGEEYCKAEFGDTAEYRGYAEANPPTLLCQTDSGRGIMDMPEEMAHKLNINATAYQSQ
jgi:hypothetical protein